MLFEKDNTQADELHWTEGVVIRGYYSAWGPHYLVHYTVKDANGVEFTTGDVVHEASCFSEQERAAACRNVHGSVSIPCIESIE